MPPVQMALLFAAAVLGGALNSVAGGGSFLTFPALVFTGVAPVAANATSTVALWPASLASAWAYRTELAPARRWLPVMALASLIGGLLGAFVLLRTPDATFVRILPFLLLVAAALFTWGKRITSRIGRQEEGAAEPSAAQRLAAGALQLVIASYGGYFGGGMGIMMLATFSVLAVGNLHTMNALKNVLAVFINGVAIVLFVGSGKVAWLPGGVMILGGLVGGYGGARLARRTPTSRVRAVVLVVAWSMTAYFFVRAFT